jgi:hypothetical protein
VPSAHPVPDKELHNLYYSPKSVVMMKSRNIGWAEKVARRETRTKFWLEILKQELRRPRRRWEIILEWMLGKQGLSCGLDPYGSGYRDVADSSDHGNEPSGSIKDGELLEQQCMTSGSQAGLSSMELIS